VLPLESFFKLKQSTAVRLLASFEQLVAATFVLLTKFAAFVAVIIAISMQLAISYNATI